MACKNENQKLHTHLQARLLAVITASIIVEKLITQARNMPILCGFAGHTIVLRKDLFSETNSGWYPDRTCSA